MCSESQQKYFCPRLLDYIVIVGSRHPNRNNSVAQTPELLRRYPQEDHKDFLLPPDVVFFCQPEGCISVGPKRMSLRESTSFVFTLTEKDSGRIRYGMCVNFYRPFDKKSHGERGRYERGGYDRNSSQSSYSDHGNTLSVRTDEDNNLKSPRTRRKQKTASRVRTNTLTSLCLISHHPFFSTFRECLFVLRRLIDSCNERSSSRRIGASRMSTRDSVWSVLTGIAGSSDPSQSLVMHDVRGIEMWIFRLLSVPVPVPGKTRVEIMVLSLDLHPPLVFALPDHTRFSLVDFPLHLPLELLGVETCLKVLSLILLEHKLVLQSRDYNALSMSVMAFVSMLYPLEYMFPVIPLLPTCMSSAEQLLLAPTPFIIGVPASFLMYKKNFELPDDVWLVDLDSNKITVPSEAEELPPLPEPEGSVLKNHLKQILDLSSAWYKSMLNTRDQQDQGTALASMSMTPQPIKNLETLAQNPDAWKRRESFSSATGFNPLIYGNDVDSVDVATRVAMVRFFNSPNLLGHFSEHTRTLRLYPRPVVAFQLNSFMKSRPVKTSFTSKLARTQAVEYFAEYALSPSNVVFLRVQTGVFDPLLIGDKAKWFCQSLQKIDFHVYDESVSTLASAVISMLDAGSADDYPTDESGSDSDGAESTSSSYSSLSDFVIDIQNSEINGETPEIYNEDQMLTVDESRVFSPPSKLHMPDMPISNSDSAMSAPDSEDDASTESSSPTYATEPERHLPPQDRTNSSKCEGEHFRYDNVTPTSQDSPQFRFDSPTTPTHIDEPYPRHGSPVNREAAKRRESFGRRDSTGRRDSFGRKDSFGRNDSPSRTEHLVRRDSAGRMDAGGRRDSTGRRESPSTTPTARTDGHFRYDSGNITPTAKDERQPRYQPPVSPSMAPPLNRQGSRSSTPERKKTPPPIPPPPQGSPMLQRANSRGSVGPVPRRSNSLRSTASMSSASSLSQPSLPQRANSLSASQLRGDVVSPRSPPSPVSGVGPPPRSPPQRSLSQRSDSIKSAGPPPPRPPPPTTIGQPLQQDATTTEEDRSPSIMSAISSEITDYAATASNTLSEFFGNTKTGGTPGKSSKPFAPLGNRKALIEKSGLVKHATNRKKEVQRQHSIDSRTNTHSDNQQFLKDVVTSVLEGQGVGFWKLNRVRKLMEDENYRNFVVSRLNTSLDRKLTDEDQHVEDTAVSRSVFKGMLTMVKALIAGLEFTYQNQGIGGMASGFMVLEIIHTHYWEKDAFGSSKSDTSNQSLTSSPFGSRESLSSLTVDNQSAKMGDTTRNWNEEQMVPSVGSPVIVNGDEFENIELRKPSDVNNAAHHGVHRTKVHHSNRDLDNNENSKTQEFMELSRNIANLTLGHQVGSSSESERNRELSSGYGSESGDMLRDFVKNKELMQSGNTGSERRRGELPRYSSVDSDVSEGSTLMMNFARKKRSPSMLSVKSHLSTGYRYHEGRMLNLNLPSPETNRTYLFEGLIGKDRSWLWDQMQFWEDAFLDGVAQERDIIGMDQGPTEMMERYNSMSDADKRRLEHDEDRLLGTLLYNSIAFMVMMRVSKNEVRRKVRRLLGKCHIGLIHSQNINTLLDQINSLHGNDIDLKPMGSRLMQKQSFTVHWGPDNSGDMLFMEVCDDCIILRSVTGAICDRWWYEKLVNMTYCPKTKVLCLWRKHADKTQLNKFYTKKCKDLYFCVKEAMERAAARNNGKIPGPELGGEFPVQDMKTGQGGLLQVCMEGIGLLFANSKDVEFFIELSRIKKCFTQKDGIFVLEEFDPKTRKVIQRKYKSNMANEILLAFHRVITVHSTVARTPPPSSPTPIGRGSQPHKDTTMPPPSPKPIVASNGTPTISCGT